MLIDDIIKIAVFYLVFNFCKINKDIFERN